MPHLTIEFSSNLSAAITPAILRNVNHALLGTGQLVFQRLHLGPAFKPRAKRAKHRLHPALERCLGRIAE